MPENSSFPVALAASDAPSRAKASNYPEPFFAHAQARQTSARRPVRLEEFRGEPHTPHPRRRIRAAPRPRQAGRVRLYPRGSADFRHRRRIHAASARHVRGLPRRIRRRPPSRQRDKRGRRLSRGRRPLARRQRDLSGRTTSSRRRSTENGGSSARTGRHTGSGRTSAAIPAQVALVSPMTEQKQDPAALDRWRLLRGPEACADFLAGGGEMGARMRAHDWAATGLGPPEGWPPLSERPFG